MTTLMPYTNQRSCWRSSPCARRNRTTTAPTAPAAADSIVTVAASPSQVHEAIAGTEKGLATYRSVPTMKVLGWSPLATNAIAVPEAIAQPTTRHRGEGSRPVGKEQQREQERGDRREHRDRGEELCEPRTGELPSVEPDDRVLVRGDQHDHAEADRRVEPPDRIPGRLRSDHEPDHGERRDADRHDHDRRKLSGIGRWVHRREDDRDHEQRDGGHAERADRSPSTFRGHGSAPMRIEALTVVPVTVVPVTVVTASGALPTVMSRTANSSEPLRGAGSILASLCSDVLMPTVPTRSGRWLPEWPARRAAEGAGGPVVARP